MIGGLFLRSLVLCFRLTSDWALFCKSEIWLNLNLKQIYTPTPGGVYFFLKFQFFLKLRPPKTVRFPKQILSRDNCPKIFLQSLRLFEVELDFSVYRISAQALQRQLEHSYIPNLLYIRAKFLLGLFICGVSSNYVEHTSKRYLGLFYENF